MITVLVLNQSLETARLCLEDVHCFFAREEIIIIIIYFLYGITTYCNSIG